MALFTRETLDDVWRPVLAGTTGVPLLWAGRGRVLLGPCEHRANPSPPAAQDYQAPGLSRARGESWFRGFWLCIIHHNTFTFSDIAIYFWLCWVFVAASGLSLVATSGGYSWLWCAGFSLRCLLLFRAWAPGAGASVGAARGLRICGSRALYCGARAQLLWGVWDLPGPEMEPSSPHWQVGSYPPCHQGSSMVRFPSLLLQNPKSHCWWTPPVLRHSADDLLVGAKSGSYRHCISKIEPCPARLLRDNSVRRNGHLDRESRLGACHFGISHFGNSVFWRPRFRASPCKNWKVTWHDRNPGVSGDVDWQERDGRIRHEVGSGWGWRWKASLTFLKQDPLSWYAPFPSCASLFIILTAFLIVCIVSFSPRLRFPWGKGLSFIFFPPLLSSILRKIPGI